MSALPRLAVLALLAPACASLDAARRGTAPDVGTWGRVSVLDREDFNYALAFSADGETLAHAHLSATGFRVATWTLAPVPVRRSDVQVCRAEWDVEGVALAPDGSAVFSVARDGWLRAFDTASGELLASFDGGEPLVSVAVDAAGGRIAVGGARGRVALLAWPGLSLRAAAALHADEVRAVAFTPGGEVWSGGWDRAVVRSVEEGAALGVQRRHGFPWFVNDVTASDDGRWLGVAFSVTRAVRSLAVFEAEQRGTREAEREGNAAAVVDAESGAVAERWLTHRGVVSSAAISPDGRRLASGGWDRRLLLHERGQSSPARTRTYGWSVRRVRWGPRGASLGVAAWTPQNAVGDRASEPAAEWLALE
jgi:WD40 repeat protein